MAVLSPVRNGVWLPFKKTCVTEDVPGANGAPLKSVTSSRPPAYAMPVGTASSKGPPTAGNSGFGMSENSVSFQNAPVGMSICQTAF